MRPTFADTLVTEAGVAIDLDDLAAQHRDDRKDRAAAYREWRRTRVLFMSSVSEAERAVVDGVADLPAQRRRSAP